MSNRTKIVLTVAVLVGAALFTYKISKFGRRPLVPVPIAGAHPAIGGYWQAWTNGEPFAHAGVVDSAKLWRAARWDVAAFDILGSPIVRDWQRLLRSYNPRATYLAFSAGGSFFVCGMGWAGGVPIPGCDTSLVSYAWARWRVIRAHNAVLYNAAGQLHGGRGHVDWSRPGVDTSLADVFVKWATRDAGVFNGVFSDETSYSIIWTDSPTSRIDYRRAGFKTLAAWDSAYRAGVVRYFNRLREKLPQGWPIVANFGGKDGPTIVNGRMLENFPYQHQVTVHDCVRGDTAYMRPTLNMLTVWSDGNRPPDADLMRRHRFALGVATLGPGVGFVTGATADPSRGFLPLWWDEWSVDGGGRADTTGAHKGWLGLPQSGPVAIDALFAYRRNFARGTVLVNGSNSAASVVLEPGRYRRIVGVIDRVTNNGARADTIVVPPQDALFLVRR